MKRSILTLFSGENDILSHILRLALTEKGIAYDVEIVSNEENNYSLSTKKLRSSRSQRDSYKKATIVDRDLVINDVHIALDYLDDKYPHPSLYPSSPEKKAKVRLLLKNIEKNIMDDIVQLNYPDSYQVNVAIEKLSTYITSLEPIWDPKTTYILGEEFSIIDCFLVPVIYKLIRHRQSKKSVNIPAIVAEYYRRIHNRDKFINSLQIRSSRGFMHEKTK